MLLAAIKEVSSVSPEVVQKYTGELIRPSVQALTDAGYRIAGEESRGNHLFGIRLPEHVNADRLKSALLDENIIVSWRGDAMRVSPNVYNTVEEIERFASILLKEIQVQAS